MSQITVSVLGFMHILCVICRQVAVAVPALRKLFLHRVLLPRLPGAPVQESRQAMTDCPREATLGSKQDVISIEARCSQRSAFRCTEILPYSET